MAFQKMQQKVFYGLRAGSKRQKTRCQRGVEMDAGRTSGERACGQAANNPNCRIENRAEKEARSSNKNIV